MQTFIFLFFYYFALFTLEFLSFRQTKSSSFDGITRFQYIIKFLKIKYVIHFITFFLTRGRYISPYKIDNVKESAKKKYKYVCLK